tara:strand:- start:1030 stop:1680 length:651 start_codon:yes stop_codon:yes gene_type:complete
MNNGIVEACNIYGRYAIPKNSLWRIAAQTVLEGEVWEPDTIKYIINNCGNSSIIHAGTYFGDFLPALSKHCKNTVFAFEPNTESYGCARKTCLFNNCKNVILKNNALGSCTKMVNLKIKDKDKYIGGLSSVVDDESPDTEKVCQVKIDDVICDTTPISILHLDLEGYELNAINGAINIVKNWKPIIIIEDNGNNYIDLENLGYRYTKRIDNNLVWR